jgi:hypothetical protein
VKQGNRHHWKFSKAFVGSRSLRVAFRSPEVYYFITKLCLQEAAVIQVKSMMMFPAWEKVKQQK